VDGLIGHTGFVGSILAAQHDFAGRFNSTNIGAIAGRSFDTLVCAAAPGSMFEANRFRQRDSGQIDGLIASLDSVGTVERFVTARAGQLGYRVCEIGVHRSYPAGEAVPTKINGASAKWAIIRQLLRAASGRFNPGGA
jgi:hypothetical protein